MAVGQGSDPRDELLMGRVNATSYATARCASRAIYKIVSGDEQECRFLVQVLFGSMMPARDRQDRYRERVMGGESGT